MDVFFVVSGYVITGMLTIELVGSGRLDLKRFYLRPIRRLLPALGLMLSVVMLASVLLTSIGGQKVTVIAFIGIAQVAYRISPLEGALSEHPPLGGHFE